MSEYNFDEVSESNAGLLDKAAADWILAKQLAEHWSVEDQAALDNWLSESDAHLLSYWRLEAIWLRSHRLKALRTPMRRSQEIRVRRSKPYAVGLAAILVVGTLATFVSSQNSKPAPTNTYSTPIGGHLTLTLADGSKIELNTDSAVKVSSSPGKRFATLEKGEALFEIVHDPAHPFVVTTAGQRIVDLGTKFSVRNEESYVRVALIEGSARVESTENGNTVRATDLQPGDVALATASSLTVSKEPVAEIKRALGWRSGVLVFDNTTLGDAASELNRYNTSKILVSDPKIARLIIGGTFRQNDVSALLNTAKQVFGLKVHRQGSDFEITH